MIDVAEPAAPVKRPSHWARRRAAERLYQDQLALNRESDSPHIPNVNPLRRQRRANHIAALFASANAVPAHKFSDRLPSGYGLDAWRVRADGVLCFPDPRGKVGEPVQAYFERMYAESAARLEAEQAE